MLGRVAATVALFALVGCAGMEPAGRTAQREAEISHPAPVAPPNMRTLPPPTHTVQSAPVYSAPQVMPPPPASVQSAPVQTQASPPPPPVAAANVSVSRPTPTQAADPNDVVVHGSAPEQQVRPPNGDPRSLAERREDIQNWDHCVMQAMAQQSDPNSVQMTSPEDLCSRRLGQSSRNAIPQSRVERRRL